MKILIWVPGYQGTNEKCLHPNYFSNMYGRIMIWVPRYLGPLKKCPWKFWNFHLGTWVPGYQWKCLHPNYFSNMYGSIMIWVPGYLGPLKKSPWKFWNFHLGTWVPGYTANVYSHVTSLLRLKRCSLNLSTANSGGLLFAVIHYNQLTTTVQLTVVERTTIGMWFTLTSFTEAVSSSPKWLP